MTPYGPQILILNALVYQLRRKKKYYPESGSWPAGRATPPVANNAIKAGVKGHRGISVPKAMTYTAMQNACNLIL